MSGHRPRQQEEQDLDGLARGPTSQLVKIHDGMDLYEMREMYIHPELLVTVEHVQKR